MSFLFRHSLSAVALLAACTFPLSAQAHSSRTNAEGCHNNRSSGTYHCHNSKAPSSAPVVSTEGWAVVSVGDGDTIRVRQGSETQTVRLACIDAPEMQQPTYGELAKQQLQALLPVDTVVSLRPVDTDRYNRLVAEVLRSDGNVNLSLVATGHAVTYRQYLSNCNAEAYLDAEAIARQSGLVFWSQNSPVMPWDFRRQRQR